ncbi:MAG: HAMP domain-containing histidine kinase [Butyrivibrio sp.]|nr:HAMP domain-containing histidine kinase [Butyrivibrio sp.]
MTRQQKLALIAACIFYVLTVFGFFYFSLTLILVLFALFSLSIAYFAYLCYRAHNDYTGAEHLQQEIGVLKAEKEQMRYDYETLLETKDEEIEKRQENIESLKEDIRGIEKERDDTKAELEEMTEKITTVSSDNDSLLPPDNDDDTATVDIIAIANQAVKELEGDARSAGIRVNISCAHDKLLVNASANRLKIMFRNIIDNSIKYMNKQGSLVITISTIDDDIFIVLKDTGDGLPENETEHIFELNYQGSNRISGNGLGLTQAKAIVDHYGGMIYARSPEGGGMGIYIQLPTTHGGEV